MPRDFYKLSRRILYMANKKLMQIDFLHEVSKLFLDFSGCYEVEIFVRERTKYHIYRTRNSNINAFSLDSIPLTDTPPHSPDPSGREIRPGNLRNICREFITGDRNAGIFDNSDQRLFWTNNTGESDIIAENDASSLLIMPISYDRSDLGLLLLKSDKLNFFREKEIHWYGEVIEMLGLAFNQQMAQFALRERVKELTCLFSIAKAAARHDLPLDEMLQNVVELLPPGWLYPEIAQGKITFKNKSYASSVIERESDKLTAGILVNGEICGQVEVIYCENKPELDEGPFLKEERSLINAIARELGIIIERKLAAAEKDKLREQLRHADRLATIGQLAAGVAHELNEPLGSILGFAQLSQKSEGAPEVVVQDLQKIVNASLNARETIKKLLVFARQTPSQMAPAKLNDIIKDCLDLLSGRLIREGITLNLALDENLPNVLADPSQINQVLVNLIVNSMHAMPGVGTLSIETKSDDSSVYILIEDTGIGMNDDVKKLIFVPFFTTKDVDQGTGLGLAVVHGIVISHGGTIKVESEIGRGSKFEIRLPVMNGS